VIILSLFTQNKLLKTFSNQLFLKHQCLKQLEDEEEYAAVPLEKVKNELDQLISLEQFLNVTGLEAKSTKVRTFITPPPPLPVFFFPASLDPPLCLAIFAPRDLVR
jgi:hypothetical protein